MLHFIVLHQAGKPIGVNMSLVRKIQTSNKDGATILSFSNGDFTEVDETPEDLMHRIGRNWGNGGADE
jgi:hypothetical protein